MRLTTRQERLYRKMLKNWAGFKPVHRNGSWSIVWSVDA